ncbi:exonuclease v [Stemphylium lycopersici]|uniref:Exonuclease v n=1 Tax=Stemphylium lycopersici TaxID=183478 RepID=A0A364N2J7_STELY|nr:exonuclease v [Stemphylium lycopersici]
MTWQSEFWSWMSPPALQTAETPAVGQKAPATPKLDIPAQHGKPTIISFLRHCGCPFAEKTFLDLRAIAPAHPRIHFVAVSHSDQESTDRWLASLPDPPKNTQPNLQVIVDTERETYAAWGLGTSGFMHVLGSIPGASKLGKDKGINVRPTESGSRWQTAGNFAVDSEARPTATTRTTLTPRPDHGIMAGDYGSDIEIASVATLSDYGSDIDIDDDSLLADAFDTIRRAVGTEKRPVLPSIEFEEGEIEDEEHHVDGFVQIHKPSRLRVTRNTTKSGHGERGTLEVEYDERSRRAWSVPVEPPAPPPQRSPSASRRSAPRAKGTLPAAEAVDVAENDRRSPLERFRTKPKKPLSVTDLVSPAWCELQYLYTLSKFGRKPPTQAMRTGTKIHEKLEAQVHTTVPVQVESKEDRFGLRMWNAISGLRCLRTTGLTRELEVWGILDGQVVNGIIDELTYHCPDVAFEEQLEKSRAEKRGGIVPLPPGQLSISEAFAKSSNSHDTSPRAGTSQPGRQVYIADVKTRSANSLPTGASLRPTWMQLMLYRRLLESLSLNTVDAETIFSRYDLQPLENFTDAFMQAIHSIGPHEEASSYPNLLSLWSLLITEMQATFPATALSPILRAEFRYAKTGHVIGSELTVYEADVIDGYISEELAWWKGHREAKGVEVEEAFKCRICDFAENCSWRKTKVEEAIAKTRLRREAKEKSAV